MNSPPTPPVHVALIMDGNGRWAEIRKRPRNMGHQAGVKALRRIVEHSARSGVRFLTVFAFSSENWNRPQKEVSRLMELLLRALDKEVTRIHENNVRVRFIGDLSAFSAQLRQKMRRAETLTRDNRIMTLNVATNYGGRWDIVQALQDITARMASGALTPEDIDEDLISSRLSLSDQPDPDLLIRTGGDVRISNFLLWQSAYTELIFSSVLWPDFDAVEFDRAVAEYHARERRHGETGEQVRKRASA
jgi:undecaprenyl diphosphate synthase